MKQFILFKRHNDDNVPLSGDLQKWVNHQNNCRKKNWEGKDTALTVDMIAMLDQVQFPWKLCNDQRWHMRFCELSKFKEEHGTCRVPHKSGGGLGEWVRSQRKSMKQHVQGKNSQLTSERIEKLDSIGFEWNLHNWEAMFLELRDS